MATTTAIITVHFYRFFFKVFSFDKFHFFFWGCRFSHDNDRILKRLRSFAIFYNVRNRIVRCTGRWRRQLRRLCTASEPLSWWTVCPGNRNTRNGMVRTELERRWWLAASWTCHTDPYNVSATFSYIHTLWKGVVRLQQNSAAYSDSVFGQPRFQSRQQASMSIERS